MKILLTGGAGFIGSHLCRALLNRGFKVICVDNFITSLKDKISDFLDNKNFRLIEHDITKPLKVEKVDWVMHFASPASPKDYLNYPIQTLKVGALGTHNCLGIAKKFKAKFFLASTSEVYGDPLMHPQSEEYVGNVNFIGPRGVYDEAKRFAESLTIAYHKEHNIDIRIARIFNTYGPGMKLNDGRVIPNFITQALLNKNLTVYGRGDQTRSFCYIDDLIRGILLLMDSGYKGPVNLGNPQEIRIVELAKKIIEITGSNSRIEFLPLPEDDPKRRCPDINLAKKILGWEPVVGLEEGLRRTVEYFKRLLRSEEEFL